MPLGNWELLEAKLYLLERGAAFEDLVQRPLIDFIKKTELSKPILVLPLNAKGELY
jgi:hypothetical protein